MKSVFLLSSPSVSREPAPLDDALQSIATILSVHLLQSAIYIQITYETQNMATTASPSPYPSPFQKLPRAHHFLEMFEELKSYKEEGIASIQCAAKQQGVARCGKHVDLTEQILEKLPNSILDVQFQSAVQLLEMMLCPKHHQDTRYAHMLLLDWYKLTFQNPSIRISDDTVVGEWLASNLAIGSPRSMMPGTWDFEDPHQSSSRMGDWLLEEYRRYVEMGRCPSEAYSVITDLNASMVEFVNDGSINCTAEHSNGSRCPVLISQGRVQAAKSKIEYLQQSNASGKRGPKLKISKHIPDLIQHMLCSVHLCFNSLYTPSADYDLVFPQTSISEPSQIGSPVKEPPVPDPQHTYTDASESHRSTAAATPPLRPSSPRLDSATFETPQSTSTAFTDAPSSMRSDQTSGLESSPTAWRGKRGSVHSTHALPSPSPSNVSDNAHEQSFDSLNAHESPRSHSVTPESEIQGIQRRPTYLFRNPSEITHSLKDAMDGRVKVESRVYILHATVDFKSKESGHKVSLIKIGISGNPTRRQKRILKCPTPGCGNCWFGEPKEYDSFTVAAPFHRRAEKLCHRELANFNCLNLDLDSIEPRIVVNHHREWFLVSTDVAKKCVKRWVDFVNAAYNPEGRIDNFWSKHIGNMPDPSDEERISLEQKRIDVHHALRHNRLQKWLEDGLKKQPKLKP